MWFLISLILSISTNSETYHPSECSISSYRLQYINNEELKLHGLWPEKCCQCDSCGYPTYCKNTTLNQSSLGKELIDTINEVYANDTISSLQLSEHEYLKHGSCTDTSESEFFLLSIRLFERYRQYSPCVLLDNNFNILNETCN